MFYSYMYFIVNYIVMQLHSYCILQIKTVQSIIIIFTCYRKHVEVFLWKSNKQACNALVSICHSYTPNKETTQNFLFHFYHYLLYLIVVNIRELGKGNYYLDLQIQTHPSFLSIQEENRLNVLVFSREEHVTFSKK